MYTILVLDFRYVFLCDIILLWSLQLGVPSCGIMLVNFPMYEADLLCCDKRQMFFVVNKLFDVLLTA